MSDPSERPSESMPGPDTGGLKPLSNAEDMPLSNPSNSELSRIMSRAGITMSNGFPLDGEEEEEEADEDYVAVDQEDANEFPYWFRRPPTHHRTKLDELHPFVQLLSTSNVEDCVAVENAFPEQERCSRDKVRKSPFEDSAWIHVAWLCSIAAAAVIVSCHDRLKIVDPRQSSSEHHLANSPSLSVHLPLDQMPRAQPWPFHSARH